MSLSRVPRLASRLLRWYSSNARVLPWRDQADPYGVWVSEIMLQQTRVDTVLPYYVRWMKRFPTIESLARARERSVLRLWEGLGYYSRARHLREAARLVVRRFGGKLPADPKNLQALPGIGAYTAGAIASIAFGHDQPSLDGNVARVLARVFNVRKAADTPGGKATLWKLAEANLPKGRAGEYNQALMDLGATVCIPRRPRCGSCPVADLCVARRLGTQSRLPVLTARRAIPRRIVASAAICRRGRVLIRRRRPEGLLGGMWSFPSVQVSTPDARQRGRGAAPVAALKRRLGLRAAKCSRIAILQHAYTHYRVTVYAYSCEVDRTSPNSDYRWVRIDDLANYPMGKIDRQIAIRLRT